MRQKQAVYVCVCTPFDSFHPILRRRKLEESKCWLWMVGEQREESREKGTRCVCIVRRKCMYICVWCVCVCVCVGLCGDGRVSL
jgi:hypothetical protein